LGGWLVDQVSWRAIFLLNVPLAIAAAGLALRFACESSDPEAKQLDWSGAATVAIGLAAQAEASLLRLVAALQGSDERAAQALLKQKISN
jgi:MFS family permease